MKNEIGGEVKAVLRAQFWLGVKDDEETTQEEWGLFRFRRAKQGVSIANLRTKDLVFARGNRNFVRERLLEPSSKVRNGDVVRKRFITPSEKNGLRDI